MGRPRTTPPCPACGGVRTTGCKTCAATERDRVRRLMALAHYRKRMGLPELRELIRTTAERLALMKRVVREREKKQHTS